MTSSALALSLGISLLACGGGDGGSNPPDPRTALANQLNAVSVKLDAIHSSTGDKNAEYGSTGATLAAAAVIAGADIQTVTVTPATLAAFTRMVGPNATVIRPRGAVAATGDYQVVAAQQIAPGGTVPDFSAIIAWKDQTDYVMTYAFGEGTADFSTSPTEAWGTIYNPPSSVWIASTGTVSLTRTSLGGACQNIGNNPNLVSCNLATFNGSVNIASTTAGPNTTGTTDPTFAFGSHAIGGIYIVGELAQ